MTPRKLIAAGTAIAFLHAAIPRVAQAEPGSSASELVAPTAALVPEASVPSDSAATASAPDVLAMTSDVFARARASVPTNAALNGTPFHPALQDLRLSSGAKTAIIITAIIVGALIVVGLVVVAKPGKRLP